LILNPSEKGNYGPEVHIEFTNGTVFNACLRSEPFIEAKHMRDEHREPAAQSRRVSP